MCSTLRQKPDKHTHTYTHTHTHTAEKKKKTNSRVRVHLFGCYAISYLLDIFGHIWAGHDKGHDVREGVASSALHPCIVNVQSTLVEDVLPSETVVRQSSSKVVRMPLNLTIDYISIQTRTCRAKLRAEIAPRGRRIGEKRRHNRRVPSDDVLDTLLNVRPSVAHKEPQFDGAALWHNHRSTHHHHSVIARR